MRSLPALLRDRTCYVAYTSALVLDSNSSICWGMLSALTASGMLEEAAVFLQVRAHTRRHRSQTRGCMPSIVRPDPPLVHAIQNRPVHLPLLVSVVGLSLRPVFLGVPRTAEVDQCRIRFCTSVACVPKLVDSVPSAMASMFRRPRLWAALLPVLATSTSMSGLPVLECVPCHLVWTSSTRATL